MTQVSNNPWKPNSMWYGVKQKAVDIESFGPSVPAEAKTKALGVRDAILKGTLHPFAGPIYKQDGALVLAKGKSLDDAALSKMNYYVKGVDGALPK
mgnify:CR=1 FL=1